MILMAAQIFRHPHITPMNTPTKTLAAVLTGAGTVFAGPTMDDAKNPSPLTIEEPISLWEVTAAAGLGLTSGNSDTLAVSAQILATYVTDEREFYTGADYFYGENDGEQTTNSYRAFADYNRLLSDRFYLGLANEFLADDQAGLDYRVSTVPLLGYYVIKNDTTKLAFEAGFGYLWEDQGVEDEYAVVRAAQRFELALSDRVSLWEKVAYFAEAGDFNNYTITAEVGISTRLTDSWALRTVARNTYDATPAAGADENDLTVLSGLSYTLGGIKSSAAASGRPSLFPGAPGPAGDPDSGWTRSAAFGLALTDGNSDTLLYTAEILADYRNDEYELFLGLSGAYGENDGVTNTEQVSTRAQYNKLLNENLFLGIQAPFLYDAIADVDYRVVPALTLGTYLIKNDTASLSFEAGPAYTFEKVGGIADEYFSVVAQEKFALALNDTVSFSQYAGINYDPSDSDNYILSGGAAITVGITDHLAFKTGVGVTYDNSPALGREKEDVLLSSSIALRF